MVAKMGEWESLGGEAKWTREGAKFLPAGGDQGQSYATEDKKPASYSLEVAPVA